MADRPGNHHRRSVRLKGYDYSLAGAYFVTICTQDRVCLFGDVVDGEMRLNACGEAVRDEWFRSREVRGYVRLDDDEFVVMPNHVHGIIWIMRDVGATRRVAPTDTPRGPVPRSIGAIIGQFKPATTKRIRSIVGNLGTPVWQRNYYEHVIRDERSLDRIRQYIRNNPTRWAFDRDNPAAIMPEPENTWSV